MGSSPRHFSIWAIGLGIAVALASPSMAQFSDSYVFLKAIRDRDGDKVMSVIDKPGTSLDTRDTMTGEAALHIIVKRHDMTWLNFLLARGANPDIRDRDGNTPLMIAASTGDVESARLLIQVGAKVNAVNGSGESPLILATHRRDVNLVRMLISNGADPRLRDTIAGKSSAEYAKEDSRGAVIAKILDEAKPAAKPAANVSGPVR